MKYKALISDFDNTLVGPPLHSLEPDIVSAIKLLLEKGVIFTIATGRSYYGNIHIAAKQLELTCPVITAGGAEIVNPLTGEVILGEYIPRDEYTGLIEYLLSLDVLFIVEYAQHIYSSKSFNPSPHFGELFLHPLSELKEKQITKILLPSIEVGYDLETVTKVEQHIMDTYPDIHVVKTRYNGKFGMDITPKKATKHMGVLHFLTHMNLHESDVAGIGDGYNDYPLLSACGLKLAMGDGPEELLAIADDIMPTQQEKGILTAIGKYFS